MEAMIFKVPPEDPLTDCATVSGACPRAAPSRSSGRAFILWAYRNGLPVFRGDLDRPLFEHGLLLLGTRRRRDVHSGGVSRRHSSSCVSRAFSCSSVICRTLTSASSNNLFP
jgi:hypothetical protein